MADLKVSSLVCEPGRMNRACLSQQSFSHPETGRSVAERFIFAARPSKSVLD
jgi:hypothetical protein